MQVAQRGQKLTQDTINKASAGHYYIKAGEKGGHLQLSGAPKRWAKAETANDIYVPGFRVAGNHAAVQSLLKQSNLSDADIQVAIKDAYTNANQDAMKTRFEAETNAAMAYRKNAPVKATRPTISLAELGGIITNIKGEKPTRGPGAGRGRAKATEGAQGSPGRRGVRRPLNERLGALPEGKVLDVSAMKADGTGVKMIGQPKPSSKKIGVEGLRIVSSNPDNFYAAVHMLGPEFKKFEQAYRARMAAPQAVTAIAPTVTVPAAVHPVRAPSPKVATTTTGMHAIPTLGALPTLKK